MAIDKETLFDFIDSRMECLKVDRRLAARYKKKSRRQEIVRQLSGRIRELRYLKRIINIGIMEKKIIYFKDVLPRKKRELNAKLT